MNEDEIAFNRKIFEYANEKNLAAAMGLPPESD
jgi:hypothetical protein